MQEFNCMRLVTTRIGKNLGFSAIKQSNIFLIFLKIQNLIMLFFFIFFLFYGLC